MRLLLQVHRHYLGRGWLRLLSLFGRAVVLLKPVVAGQYFLGVHSLKLKARGSGRRCRLLVRRGYIRFFKLFVERRALDYIFSG